MPGTQNRGAVAARAPKKSPLGWLIPVAVLLLLVIIAVVALLLLNENDKGDEPGIDVKDDPQALSVQVDEVAVLTGG